VILAHRIPYVCMVNLHPFRRGRQCGPPGWRGELLYA